MEKRKEKKKEAYVIIIKKLFNLNVLFPPGTSHEECAISAIGTTCLETSSRLFKIRCHFVWANLHVSSSVLVAA